jgi:hypothetical protein
MRWLEWKEKERLSFVWFYGLVVVLGNEVEVTTTLLYLPRLAILSLHSADWLCIHCIALATWIG